MISTTLFPLFFAQALTSSAIVGSLALSSITSPSLAFLHALNRSVSGVGGHQIPRESTIVRFFCRVGFTTITPRFAGILKGGDSISTPDNHEEL